MTSINDLRAQFWGGYGNEQALLQAYIDAGITLPAIAQGALTQTYATADATLANPTAAAVDATAATNVAPYGFSQAQANAIVTELNHLRNDHLDLMQFVNSLVDKLQAAGHFQ